MENAMKRQLKKSNLAIAALLLGTSITGFANKPAPKVNPIILQAEQLLQHHVNRLNKNWWVEGGYAHSSFNFDSDSGNNLNHYNGHNNVYTLSVWRLFQDNFMLGFNYQHVLTGVSSRLRINDVNTYGQTNIKGNYFGLRLRKYWVHKFYLEAFAQYGYNATQLTQTNINSVGSATGNTTYDGDLFTTGASTGLIYPFLHKFIFGANFSVFYLKSKYDGYVINFGNGTSSKQSSYNIGNLNLTENINLQYVLSDHIRPYAEFGLLQVPYRGRSQEAGAGLVPFTSQIPGLELGKSGYNAGGGVELVGWKTLTFRVGYVYFRRGHEFRQNYIFTHLSYAF